MAGYAGKVVVVAGPPCSGKGTQCKRLAAQLGLVHVSTGDVFRDAVARRTPLGLQAKGYMDRGRFVPDELMIQFVTDRLAQPDVAARGCLLDGFPRTGPQARTLAAAVKVERFVVLQVPDKALQARAVGRRIDPVTGDIYNLKYVPPPPDVVARLEPRQYDDDAGTFRVRLDVFHKHIRQIIPSFGQRVWMVDAMRPPDAVLADLARCLEATAGATPGTPAAGGAEAVEAVPKEAPPQFCCAITQEVMQDPVTTADGHVYEREAIETWLQEHATSPLTGQVLKHKHLTPAAALRATIETWASGAMTVEEVLSGSVYVGPGTANNPVARTSEALDVLPESSLGMPPVGPSPEPQSTEAGDGGGAEAAAEHVDVSIMLSGDGVHDASGVQHVVVEVTVGEALRREPVDICCVIDVSGSMGEEATHEAPDGTIHSDGLSILDLVKHAVKTMVHMMEPEDRLALVAFSDTSKMVLPPTPMGDAGKADALLAVESLLPDGATNLWDGLKNGLDCLLAASLEDDVAGVPGRKSTVMLLTDGVPNEVPDGGHHLAFSSYKDASPDFRFQVNTLGFGVTLDSDLLADIAVLGDGTFAFIPDSKIMGTVFVNCLANVIATATQQSSLSLTTPITRDSPVGDAMIVGRPLGDYSCSAESWGLQVDLGPLQYGQTRSIAVPMAIPLLTTTEGRAAAAAKAQKGEAAPPYLEAKLEFTRSDGTEVLVVARPSLIPQTAPSAHAVLTTLRCDVITTGRLAIAAADAGDMGTAHATIDGLIERFARARAETKENESAHAALLLLQSDVEGRLSKALSRKERFERWGKHYLRALLRAHQVQLQTNFMDPGLKSYGGALFEQVRDAGGLIFAALPAPQPPPKTCPICGEAFGLDCTDLEMQRHTESHFGGPPAPAAPVRRTRVVRAQTRAPNMADFYQGEGGGCFGRGSTCMVCKADSTEFVRTDVTAVQQGDFIRVAGGGSAEVVAAVTILEPTKASLCELPGGLRITSKHPVRMNGQWQMPTALPEARIVRNSSGLVTNFILRGDDGRLYNHGYVLLVNGIECASWGHGIKTKGVAHDFWGSERVIEALANCRVDGGRVVVRGCVRDGRGEVVEFVA